MRSDLTRDRISRSRLNLRLKLRTLEDISVGLTSPCVMAIEETHVRKSVKAQLLKRNMLKLIMLKRVMLKK